MKPHRQVQKEGGDLTLVRNKQGKKSRGKRKKGARHKLALICLMDHLLIQLLSEENTRVLKITRKQQEYGSASNMVRDYDLSQDVAVTTQICSCFSIINNKYKCTIFSS